MRRVLSLVTLLVSGSWISGNAEALAQELAAADRAPRFYLAAADGSMRKDVSSVVMLRRRISVAFSRVPLEEALQVISDQAKLRLFYSRDLLPEATRVSLAANDITVTAALTEILLDTGLDVVVSPAGRMTLVRRSSNQSSIAPGTIVGLVTNATTGEKIAGADVFLEKTEWRVSTDTSGRYRLTNVEAGHHTMTVRRLGYSKQSRQIVVRTRQEDTVDVALQPVAVALNDLVTTATGPQRRRDISNAITTIRADSVLETAPIRSLTDLLENRVPGLTVQRTSGAPGDPSRLRLRGLGSVLQGNDPVVFVDGIRLYAAHSDARSGNLTNFGKAPRLQNAPDGSKLTVLGNTGDFGTAGGSLPAPSPLDQIDPNIIEKIEVFKGPSAATLYGADAANGVIVITTKRGRPGPTTWDAHVTRGITSTPGSWPIGYYRWGHVPNAGAVNLICPLTQLQCELDSLVTFQALNDRDLTLLDRGHITTLSLTAAGGNQALTYSVTGSYSDETGLLKLPAFETARFRTTFNREPPDWMQRPHHLLMWSVTSNVTARVGSTADITLSTTLGRTEQERSSLETKVGSVASTYVDKVNGLYYPDGVRSFNYLDDFYTRITASSITFTTGLSASWRPRSWFTAMAQAGLNVIPRDDQRFLANGLPTTADSGFLVRGTGRSLVSTFNLQGEATKPIGWGNFVFVTTAGANLTTTNTSDLVSTAAKLLPGTSSLTGAGLFESREGNLESSVFGWYVEPRLRSDRFSLSAGLRLDGGNTYGTQVNTSALGGLLRLPKLGFSWVVSEESWFPLRSVFSSLRLRTSYGQAQQRPGPRDRLRLYRGRIEELLWLEGVGNTELKPERSVELEGGFDADLLDGRMTVELSGYRKTRIDALMGVQLPGSINGGGMIIQNIGNIRNTGLEVTVGLTPVRSHMLNWNTSLSFYRNTNKLVKLGRGVETNKLQGIVEGYEVGGRWARPILGYTDADQDGILEPEEIQIGDSLVYMGRLLPASTTSLYTNLALFGGAIGVTAGFSYMSGATQIDQTGGVLLRGRYDPTTPLGERAAVVAADIGGELGTDYGRIQDVSTFRFNSLSVNYSAPAPVVRWFRAQRVLIGIQGANLGLHSTYSGKDPNVNSWSAGEAIQDTGQLPLPRTWQVSLKLQY